MRLAFRRTAWLTTASVTGRIPGFLIPVLVAAVFGAGSQTDAYFLAYNAVLLVAGTLAQGVEVSIVPYAARELMQSGGGRRFLTSTALRLSALVAGLWLVVVPVVAGVAGPALRWEVVAFAGCFTPLVLLWGPASVHSGALVAERDIAAANASMLWRGLGGLLGLALAPAGAGLWSVGLGLGFGELCRTMWLRRRVLDRARTPVVVETTPSVPFGRAAAAYIVGGVTMALVPVIEKLLALRVGPGAASHLEYATRLLIIPAVIFDGALAPQLLAGWSRRVVVEGWSPSRREIWGAVARGMLLAGGLAVVLAMFAPQLVAVLLRHGRFTTADGVAVSLLLRVLAVGFVGSMGILLTAQAYVASSRNRLLAVMMVFRGAVRLGVAVALLSSQGVLAFAVGFAVAEWCCLAALLVGCRSQASPILTTETAPGLG